MEETTNTAEPTATIQYDKDVLFQALQAGFVFNVNMLMHQMVSSQHALQQLLTAATARSVADITKNPSNEPAMLRQSVDIVLKVIDESASLHINMMRQLTEEAVKCSQVIKQ